MSTLNVNDRGIIVGIPAYNGLSFVKIGDYEDSLLGASSILLLDTSPTEDRIIILSNEYLQRI